MSIHANKTPQKDHSNAIGGQTRDQPSKGFTDDRPEAVTQRKLQSIANNSPQVKQLKAMQQMMNQPFGGMQSTGIKPTTGSNTSDTIQAKKENEEEPLQAKFPIQRKRNTALPQELQSNLETSFGQDFSGVNIEKNSQEASQMNALAYTQGENIHFAPGQFNPSSEQGKNLIGHEFTHVVQQRSGVVSPTNVMGKGLPVNDDKSLEKEADDLGKKAVNGMTVSPYPFSGSGGSGAVQAKSKVIQMAVSTWGGTWDTDKYDKVIPPAAGGRRGASIKLKFTPGPEADAEMIGLIQTAKAIKGKTPWYIGDATRESHGIDSTNAIEIDSTTKETDEATHIDQLGQFANPLYATGATGAGDTLDKTPTGPNWGQHGWRYTDAGVLKTKDALLMDTPVQTGVDTDSSNIFEVTALALKGGQKDAYYGSIKWGWKTDSAGTHELIPLQVVSQGVPSSSFIKASEQWNAGKTSTGDDTIDLPVVDVQVVDTGGITLIQHPPLKDVSLPAGTRIQITQQWHPPLTTGEVKVVDGPHTGLKGEVGYEDWGKIKDERK